MILLAGCGQDMGFNGKASAPGQNKPKKTVPKTDVVEAEGITVKRTACVADIAYTKYKYVVIEYPNGDQDIYCGINWFGDRELYLSDNHHFTRNSTCLIERSIGAVWQFGLSDGSATMTWNGLEDEKDPTHVDLEHE